MHRSSLLLCIFLLFIPIQASIYIPPSPLADQENYRSYVGEVSSNLVDKTAVRRFEERKIGIRIVDYSFDTYVSLSKQSDSPLIPAHYLIQNELAPLEIRSSYIGRVGQFIDETIGVPKKMPLNNVTVYVDVIGKLNFTTGQVIGGISYTAYTKIAIVTAHLLVSILRVNRESLEMDRLRNRLIGIDELSRITGVGNMVNNPGMSWDWELYYTMTNYYATGRCGYPIYALSTIESKTVYGKSIKIMQYLLKELGFLKTNVITSYMRNVTKAVGEYRNYLEKNERLFPERRGFIADELWRQLIGSVSNSTLIANQQSIFTICIQYILSQRFYRLAFPEEFFEYPLDQITLLKQNGILPANFGVYDAQTSEALISLVKEFDPSISTTTAATQFRIPPQIWNVFISGCSKSRTEPHGFIPIVITWFLAFCVVIMGGILILFVSFFMAFLSKRKELEQEFKGYTKQTNEND